MINFGTEFSTHSDTTQLKNHLAVSYVFISNNNPNYYANSSEVLPYCTLRISLLDNFFDLIPLFTPTLVSDAFTSIFAYPCYVLTHYRRHASALRFVQAFLTHIVTIYKTTSVRDFLQNDITVLSSIAIFLTILTAEMVNDLNDVRTTKRPIPSTESSQQLSLLITIENPSDESS